MLPEQAGQLIPPASASPPTRPRRRIRLRTRVLVSAVALVLMLAAVEVAARLYARATLRERGTGFDPELGWRPLPGVRKYSTYAGGKRTLLATNSHGWRDAEHSFAKPAGMRRVVTLGDSLVYAQPLDNEERLTELLQRRFDRLEVLNLGVNAYGTDQELRVLELEGFRYGPDIVVLVVCLYNDLEDIRHEWRWAWPKPYYTLAGGDLQLTKPQMTWALRLRTSSYLAEVLYERLWRRRSVESRLAPAWEQADPVPLFEALVRKMADECRQHGVHFLAVAAWPRAWLEAEPPKPNRRMRDVLDRLGLDVVDLREPFAARGRAGEVVFDADEVHWSARGHEVVAAEIEKVLRAKKWLD
jgi:lysophospholipase L1-like esterase